MINAIIILLGIIAIALFAVDVLMISKQNKILNDLLEQKNKKECELSQFYKSKRVNKYSHDFEEYKKDMKKKQEEIAKIILDSMREGQERFIKNNIPDIPEDNA